MDDGPATIEESIEMCRIAQADGIDTIVATPHYCSGLNEWTAEDVQLRIQDLEAALRRNRVGITILPGADVAVFPELIAHGPGSFLAINTGRYLLVEFPFDSVPTNWETFLSRLLESGLVPVITHPERNMWFLRHSEALFRSVDNGALVQITAMSIIGGFGEDARKFCADLLRNNLVHVIASDAHSSGERPPILSQAIAAASRLIGVERVHAMVTSIPAAIVEGRPVRLPEPVETPPSRKMWFSKLFS